MDTIKLKGIVMEDFTNYKVPSLFLVTSNCDWKCEKECGQKVCQNSSLASAEIKEYNVDTICKSYINNDITHAIVIGGLEPFLQFSEIKALIQCLRFDYNCMDDVVIYTGYYPEEIIDELNCLQKYCNIIIKFGRFIPNQTSHRDDVLGVDLASDNQYAEKIS